MKIFHRFEHILSQCFLSFQFSVATSLKRMSITSLLLFRNYNDVLFNLPLFYLSHKASFVTGPSPVVLSLDVHQYFLTFVMTVKNFCVCSSAAYDPLIGFLYLVGTHPAIFENISSFRILFNHLRKARIYFYYASWMQFLSFGR